MTECSCDETRLTYRIFSNGTRHYLRQCLRCGRGSACIKQATLNREDLDRAVPFDETFRDRAWLQRREAMDEAREVRNAEWWARYEAHLASPEWQALRAKVLKRANGWCEGCGDRPAVDIHHLTYEHLGNEFLWELRAVCRRCHERVHAIEAAEMVASLANQWGAKP